MSVITILGAGGFGTALAVMCQNKGEEVFLWSPFEEQLCAICEDGENKKLLPGVSVSPDIHLTTELEGCHESDLVVIATPSFAVGETAAKIASFLGPQTVVVSVAKGFNPGDNRRLSEVMEEALPRNPVVILSGPSHAEEIARGVPTTVAAASKNREAAETVQNILSSDTLRIYVNDDVIGVELGGALKNVISICAGICVGLGLGDNTRAALMTRGITEIARLGVAMGAQTETFAGLTGIGDLIVTCTSEHSRNRRAGVLVGQGVPPAEAVARIGTVEGYTAARIAYELSRQYRIDMPIVQETYAVLYQNKPIEQALSALMGRPKRHESEEIWLKETK
ncbi:MAG: NAD(P)H-dependent glycerol-3-phosphate dehydrogenase [Oscillospiraceae bacterium]|jgi:glycerol-3-phosphate dehydrogenase (NAD(P)+)